MRTGNSFLTDGAGFEGIAFAPPGAVFNPVPGSPETLDLISPGKYPKYCGAEIVAGDAYPADWQGDLLTCDFRANRVTRFELTPKDSGFVATEVGDVLRSPATSFRPIDVKLGPDGAIYIADWSNPIINHGEVDFRDPRRDRWHGRIWRLAVKNSRDHQGLGHGEKTDATPTDALFAQLLGDDGFDQRHAATGLAARGAEIEDERRRRIEPADDAGRLQLLWLSAAIGRPDGALCDRLLNADDAAIRAAAVRFYADHLRADSGASIEGGPIRQALMDPDPSVRLAAVSALVDGSAADAVAALAALDHPTDRFIDFQLRRGIRAYPAETLEAVTSAAGRKNTSRLALVLASVPPADAAGALAATLQRDGSGRRRFGTLD